MSLDWLNIPLEDFGLQHEFGPDGYTTGVLFRPHGAGRAQEILKNISIEVRCAYEELVPYDTDKYGNLLDGYPDALHWERTGEVPVIRGEEWRYKRLSDLTLSDIPDVLNTLVVLENEERQRKQVEAEIKAEERKNRKRILAKERRQRQKLGEFH